MARTKAEQETIIRWDEETGVLDIYTASPRVALRLQRRGFALAPIGSPTSGWRLVGLPYRHSHFAGSVLTVRANRSAPRT